MISSFTNVVFVELVIGLYEGTKSNITTVEGTSDEFKIRVRVHQGYVLGPLLFITAMEEATKEAI